MVAARATPTDHEWNRARRAPTVYACDRYRWLRPADPQHIGLLHPDAPQLIHITDQSNGETRTRSPRIDEAQAILDIQYPIDDIHPLDRQQRTTIRFYFHPYNKQLTLHPSRHDHELHVVKTKQNLGDRHWWACPTCGQRKKHLYYFIAGHANHTTAPAHVLGCRTCLGLTYASRSQHRCPDHDQHQARNGNLNAAMRTIARIDKKTRGDLATLEAIRKRLHRDARALGVQLPTDSRLAPPARRRR